MTRAVRGRNPLGARPHPAAASCRQTPHRAAVTGNTPPRRRATPPNTPAPRWCRPPSGRRRAAIRSWRPCPGSRPARACRWPRRWRCWRGGCRATATRRGAAATRRPARATVRFRVERGLRCAQLFFCTLHPSFLAPASHVNRPPRQSVRSFTAIRPQHTSPLAAARHGRRRLRCAQHAHIAPTHEQLLFASRPRLCVAPAFCCMPAPTWPSDCSVQPSLVMASNADAPRRSRGVRTSAASAPSRRARSTPRRSRPGAWQRAWAPDREPVALCVVCACICGPWRRGPTPIWGPPLVAALPALPRPPWWRREPLGVPRSGRGAAGGRGWAAGGRGGRPI
jgi:hypothetical protein